MFDKIAFTAAASLVLAGCSAASAPDGPELITPKDGPGYVFGAKEMIGAREAHAKSQIMQLVHDYGFARDAGDAQAYANVFAVDGKFHFQGQVYEGREQIAQRIRDANENSNTLTLHIIGLSQITFDGDASASGQHYATVYVKELSGPYTGEPEVFTGTPIVGVYTDKYSYTSEEGWKIADRAFKPIFMPE